MSCGLAELEALFAVVLELFNEVELEMFCTAASPSLLTADGPFEP
jgi:hypothetical protein